MKTPYEELGVSPEAEEGEIKRAYRKRSKKAHPDAGGSAAEFARLGTAYALLMDRDAREHYDRTGEAKRTTEASEAEAFAVGIVLQVVNNDEPTDIIGDAIAIVEDQIGKATANKAMAEAGERRYLRMSKRIRRKKRGENLISAALTNRAEEAKADALRLASEIRKRESGLKILEDYQDLDANAITSLITCRESLRREP